MRARPTSVIGAFPKFRGPGPGAPSPQQPARGRPEPARGWPPPHRARSPRGLPRGPAPLRRDPSDNEGLGLRETHGRGRGRQRVGRGRAAAHPEGEGTARWKRGSSPEAASPPSRSRREPRGNVARRPRGPQPFLRAEPEPMQPVRSRTPPGSPERLPNEPSTWPQGRPDPHPPLNALSPNMPASPGPVSSPPPPLWGRRLGGPDRLRAGNQGLRLRGPPLGGSERSTPRPARAAPASSGRRTGASGRAQP